MAPREQEPSFPAVHTLHLLEVVRRFGVSREAVLEGTGVSFEGLSEPSAKVALSQVEAMIERARVLTGEPALGFLLGLQMRVSAHGHLGFAAMTAGTLREALLVATRYAPTRTTALALELRIEAEQARLVLIEKAHFGKARDVVLLSLLVGLVQIGRALTGQELSGVAELRMEKPAYFERFAHLAAGRVRFGQKENQLCFPSHMLDMPLLLADPVASQLALAQCERELDALGPLDGIAGVRAVLDGAALQQEGFPDLAEVAARLHVSERTLKRRLASQGTTFRDLLHQAQRRAAEDLLQKEALSIDEVALRVGYSDVANFSRAFRRWTGITPGQYRRRC